MAQEYSPGEIVLQSGIYTITHDSAHADMPHEVKKEGTPASFRLKTARLTISR